MNCQAHETILAWGEHCFELVKIGDTIFAKENKLAIFVANRPRFGRYSLVFMWFSYTGSYG